eukprot:1616166-Amphidinium_carterae.2
MRVLGSCERTYLTAGALTTPRSTVRDSSVPEWAARQANCNVPPCCVKYPTIPQWHLHEARSNRIVKKLLAFVLVGNGSMFLLAPISRGKDVV